MTQAVLHDRALFDMTTLSHLGHARQRNQDFFYSAPDIGLSMVADGVGGQGDGEWASHRAIKLFAAQLDGKPPASIQAREAALVSALQAANQTMVAENRGRTGKPSGTTIAGIWAPDGDAGEVISFNIGDSPVFHFSGGDISKVSKDHSLHQMWVDGGCLGKEPGRRAIMQAMGITETLAPYLHSFRVRPGDSVLICTDGLSGTMSPERIAQLLLCTKSSRAACELLLADVLDGPAPDNVTVSVCRF